MSRSVVLGRPGQKVTFRPLGFLLCQLGVCDLRADHTVSSPESPVHSLLAKLAALSQGTWARSPQLRSTRVLLLLPPHQSQRRLLPDRDVSLLWA